MAVTEVLRALAATCEPPGPHSVQLTGALEISPPADEAEWSDLFVFQLVPYASVYLGGDGRIGGEARDRIAGFWRALGLDPPAECDHLATMLAFHAELAERSTAAGNDDEAGRWRHARRAFLFEHLLSWLPPYLTKLDEVGPPFFRRWGRLLGSFLLAEAAVAAEPDEPSIHWRTAPRPADPRTEGGTAFLDSLLTPAASGLFLTRADLDRAARELGLALRIGERRFVLETLLAQEARGVLGWLGAEAEGWSRRLAEKTTDRPAAGVFWAERAANSAALLTDLAREAD